MLAIKRQFITDAAGHPIAVILPLEEFALVADLLEQRLTERQSDPRLVLLQEAAKDRQFLDDLEESMQAFAPADQEWWEPPA